MDDVVGRSAAMASPGSDVRLPTAHMVCNGTPPVGDKVRSIHWSPYDPVGEVNADP